MVSFSRACRQSMLCNFSDLAKFVWFLHNHQAFTHCFGGLGMAAGPWIIPRHSLARDPTFFSACKAFVSIISLSLRTFTRWSSVLQRSDSSGLLYTSSSLYFSAQNHDTQAAKTAYTSSITSIFPSGYGFCWCYYRGFPLWGFDISKFWAKKASQAKSAQHMVQHSFGALCQKIHSCSLTNTSMLNNQVDRVWGKDTQKWLLLFFAEQGKDEFNSSNSPDVFLRSWSGRSMKARNMQFYLW